ncbi:ABC transporter permease [Paracoccus sediminicola]|uniref:ABC transporter permease n=1 Tax=Paracoccus sediminicola TaxID=3017783 RepID=UPI0022F06B90|nr:ABC transporter permease [Paracoccus sediminicola]WBU56323.1 ABC transporter permease [Paracoccus sediminicola]
MSATDNSSSTRSLTARLSAAAGGATNMQLLLVCFVVLISMSLLNPRFLNPYNFESMAFFLPELGILSIAVMIAMLTGGIDLSIVGIANLSAITAGLFFQRMGGPEAGIGVVLIGVGLALSVGLIGGAINGLLISRLRITPILATLGTGQVFTGIAVVLTGGPAIVGFPAAWNAIGNAKLGPVPVPFVIFIAVCLCVWLLLTRAAFGLQLMLIGTNPRAAVFAGINRARMLMYSYALTGLLSAMAGIILSGRTNAAKSDYGASYLLQAVLIAVLGGTNPAGGRGNVLGVALAVISLVMLSSGFQMMRVSNHLIDFIWGAFLIAVLALNHLLSNRKGD